LEKYTSLVFGSVNLETKKPSKIKNYDVSAHRHTVCSHLRGGENRNHWQIKEKIKLKQLINEIEEPGLIG